MNLLNLFKKGSKISMVTGGNQNPNLWPNSFFSQSLFQKFLNPTKSNITVTSESAYQLSPYWLAVRAISEDIAKLPIGLFTVDKQGRKKPILNSPLQKVLTQGFNEETDAMTGIQTLIQWMLTFGNGYAEIQRSPMGDIRLNLVHPSRVTPTRKANGKLCYIVTTHSEVDQSGRNKQIKEELDSSQMLHLKGPGNGIVGYSIGELANESLGISIAAQDFTGAFFGNNLSIGAALETDRALDAETKKSIAGLWKKKFSGSKNAGELAILDRGFKFNRLQMSSTDAELLNTRKFQVEEIARWFRIPPHKLMDMSKTAFNNVEQQDINYSTDTLTPWIRRLEVQLKFHFHKKDNTIIDIDEKALARGDMAARSKFFKEMFAMSVMSGNQIAMLEGLPEYEGGDARFIPMNLTPITQGLEAAELDNDIKKKALEEPEPVEELEEEAAPMPEPEPAEEEQPEQLEQRADVLQIALSAYLPSMKDSIDRLTKKESNSWNSAQKKEGTDQIEHLNKFYIKFEQELSDCLQIHADYICNVQGREKIEPELMLSIAHDICQDEKAPEYGDQSNNIIELLLQKVANLDDVPELNEIRQDDDGKNYIFTTNGFKEVDIIKK